MQLGVDLEELELFVRKLPWIHRYLVCSAVGVHLELDVQAPST